MTSTTKSAKATVIPTPPNRKRTPNDYFSAGNTASSPSKASRISNQQTINKVTTTLPLSQVLLTSATPTLTTNDSPTRQTIPSVPGLSTIPKFITPEEETTLLTFLSAQSWRTDLSRRVIHYGGTYCLMPPRDASPVTRHKIESNIVTADPIPPQLDFLLDRMTSPPFNLHPPTSHPTSSSPSPPPSPHPTHCIVNGYKNTQGISAHVENFRFAAPVVALSLGAGDHMRFHEITFPDDGPVRSGRAAKAERTGEKIDVWMSRRGLSVMDREAREMWQHEIVRRKKRDWRRRGGGGRV